jgi:hypothetical protein
MTLKSGENRKSASTVSVTGKITHLPHRKALRKKMKVRYLIKYIVKYQYYPTAIICSGWCFLHF